MSVRYPREIESYQQLVPAGATVMELSFEPNVPILHKKIIAFCTAFAGPHSIKRRAKRSCTGNGDGLEHGARL